MSRPRKQVHLAAHFPGVNNTTVWSDPRAGSHIEFSSFAHFARTAERAKFDFLFLAEGLRLREQNGKIYDLDVVGRPDTFTILAALAAVTDRLGLAGTINSTFNEPYEVARQFATLDHLSGGRAAWNVVTSWDAFTGENFRRGGFLPQEARYDRARTFLHTALGAVRLLARRRDRRGRRIGPVPGPAGRGQVRPPRCPFRHRRPVRRAAQPAGPAGHLPGRRLRRGPRVRRRGRRRDLRRHSTLEAGQAFYADVKGRLARYGRSRDELKILPAATFVLATPTQTRAELAHEVRLQQVSGATAIAFLEQLWNRDLSGYDPDGPLPDIDPDPGENTTARGRASVRMHRDPIATAREWRARAEAGNLSIRELIIEVTGRQSFIGSPGHGRGDDQRLRPGRRQRRLHPGTAHHARRAGRVRRHGRAAAPGAWRVPHRVHRARRCASTSGWRRSPPKRARAGGVVNTPLAVLDLVPISRARPRPRRCATASTWPSKPNGSAMPGTGSPSTT